MSQLQGKTALITGGTSGIGLATASKLVAEGVRVLIVGRNQDTLDQALETLGEGALGIAADVARQEDLERVFTTAERELGALDILFVNAGVARISPVAEVSESFFDQIFGINVKGAYFTIQRALPILRDGASVVLTTSVAAELGMAGMSVYSASKAALRSLARSLSAELVGRGIRVNAVSPGPIETPIFGKMGLPSEAVDEMGGQILSRVPVGRMGQAEEIADAVVFLASPGSTFVVGSELVVDGGMSQL
jgi:NAD(P)-dependent dehydrogenase (short-subunit alcohol dehydrogenase family)